MRSQRRFKSNDAAVDCACCMHPSPYGNSHKKNDLSLVIHDENVRRRNSGEETDDDDAENDPDGYNLDTDVTLAMLLM